MTRPHCVPLGLHDIVWVTVEFEIYERADSFGVEKRKPIGTIRRRAADQCTWKCCVDDNSWIAATDRAGLELAVRERLGRSVLLRPIEWECRKGADAVTVRLAKDGKALLQTPHGKWMCPDPYSAFRDAERGVLVLSGTSDKHAPQAELNRALDVLEDVLWQHCGDTKTNKIHSSAIGANARAMRLLAYYGRVIIEGEYGRAVVARFPKGDAR